MSVFVLLLSPLFLIRREKLSIPIHAFVFFVLILFLSLGIFYARVPEQTIIRIGEMLLIFMCLIVLQDFYRDTFYKTAIDWAVIVSGMGVSLSLIVQKYHLLPILFPEFPEYKQLYSVFGNQNLAGSYIALCIVWIFTKNEKIANKNTFLMFCSFLLGLGLWLTSSRSSWFAILFVFVFYLVEICRRRDEKNIKKYIFSAIGILLSGIFVSPYIFPRIIQMFSGNDVGFRTRLWIYDGSIRMFYNNPFLGVGLGNYYFWSPRYLGEALHSSYGIFHYRDELLTLHAHNDILELLAEGGIIIGIFVFVFYFIPFLFPDKYVWLTFLIVSFLNPVLISALHVVLAILSTTSQSLILFKDTKKIMFPNVLQLHRIWRYGLVLTMFLVVIFLTYALWIPDYKLRQAEKLLILQKECSEQYQELVKSRFATYAMWEGYAQSLMLDGDYEHAYQVLKTALMKTDSGFIYLLLGRCSKHLGKKEESIHWYRECLYRFPDNVEAKEGAMVEPYSL